MHLPDFKYHTPHTLEEACNILNQSENAAPIAGGTDLLVEMKKGLRHHQDMVSLTEIKELKLIHEDEDNLFIGAGVTHNELALSPIIKKKVMYIAEAASQIGTEQIRNMGTVGGNLCTGASCCDMAPILMALNASVEIAGLNEVRIIPIKDFFIDHREISINKTEIMKRIIVPLPGIKQGACYEKFGLRESASISVASVAASFHIENNICNDACIVIGAVAPTPKICITTNEMLIGCTITELVEESIILDQIGDSIIKESYPIDDIRGSKEFRKNILKVLTKRAIKKAVDNAEDSSHHNSGK